jgi:hypothetical protein
MQNLDRKSSYLNKIIPLGDIKKISTIYMGSRGQDTTTLLIMTILITLNTGDITYNRLYLLLILLINDFTYNSE